MSAKAALALALALGQHKDVQPVVVPPAPAVVAKVGCACDLLAGGCTCTPENHCESGTACPVVAALTPKQGDTKAAEDGGAAWTWQVDANEKDGGYWWRYAKPAAAVQFFAPSPAVAPADSSPAYYPPTRLFSQPIGGFRGFGRFFGGACSGGG